MNLVKIEQEAQGTVKLSRYTTGTELSSGEVVRLHLADCNEEYTLGATVEDFRLNGIPVAAPTVWDNVIQNLDMKE